MSFWIKPESSKFNDFWVRYQVWYDAERTFYGCINDTLFNFLPLTYQSLVGPQIFNALPVIGTAGDRKSHTFFEQNATASEKKTLSCV